MKRLCFLAVFLPLTALAQYPAQQPPGLYPYQKQQLPPGTVMVDPGGPGIPTSGLDQARQLNANQPQRQRSGPTLIQRNYDSKGGTTVITGPNGTRVCTDAQGKHSSTTLCY